MAGSRSRHSPPPIRSATRGRAVQRGSSSNRRRSPPPIRSALPRRDVHAGGSTSRAPRIIVEPADLPPPPPPPRYLGVRQREWGSWVAEIYDRHTGERQWIGTYQSAIQAAHAYDQRSRFLHGAEARLNFPDGLPPGETPDLGPIDPRVATRRQLREDREARERLEAERAGAAYMEELQRQYPGLVAEQRAKMEEYYALRHGPPGHVKEEPVIVKEEPHWGQSAGASTSGAGPSSAPSLAAFTAEDNDDSSVDWSELEAECDDDE